MNSNVKYRLLLQGRYFMPVCYERPDQLALFRFIKVKTMRIKGELWTILRKGLYNFYSYEGA
jgi:hypothetical protein